MTGNSYVRVPFIISENQYKYFVDENCEFYSCDKLKKLVKKTAGIVVEYCSLSANVKRYNKLGARLIKCTNCKKEEQNGIQKFDGNASCEKLSVNEESEDPILDFFRSVE